MVVSRLVYRKGMDFLVDVIPEICRRFPHVEWVIGGDGPKRVELEEMREKHQLHDRVEMLGNVPHSDVRDVRGHVERLLHSQPLTMYGAGSYAGAFVC